MKPKKTTIIKLSTGVYVTLYANGNIKKCISIYDGQITSLPMLKNDNSDIKVQSSYVPLNLNNINAWFNKFQKQ